MVVNWKSQFPIFDQYPNLAYLDNAATTQRPNTVIGTISKFHQKENSNIHRGVYALSTQSSKMYEETRKEVGHFLGTDQHSIAFTSGTTESVNIVARSFVSPQIEKGDNIVISILEHHSNFVPWQQLSIEKGAELRIVPIDKNGTLKLDVLKNYIDFKTKMVSIGHISNSLGTINDIREVVTIAHSKNAPVMIDAAQSAAFYDLDHQKIGYDFLAFSGHKLFGPFGVGVLFVAEPYQDQISPYNFGGGMIRNVEESNTEFAKYPFSLEAGTPNISGIMGLREALNFIQDIDRSIARNHVGDLTKYCCEILSEINGVEVIGNPASSIISFNVTGIHPHDVSSFLDKDDIALRAGMHCTQPLMKFLQVPSTVRASFSLYNSLEEVDRLKASIEDLKKFWK